MIEIDN